MKLEYGSNAPDAPHVFIDDAEFARLWHEKECGNVLVEEASLSRIQNLVPLAHLNVVSESGGKFLLMNHANSN